MVYEIVIVRTDNPREKLDPSLWSSRASTAAVINSEHGGNSKISTRRNKISTIIPKDKTEKIIELIDQTIQQTQNTLLETDQRNTRILVRKEKSTNYIGNDSSKKGNAVPPTVPKIVLVAGNVGRNFVKKLIKIENAYEEIRYNIFSILKPGASREELIETAIHASKSLTSNDTIILWPNDVRMDKGINLEYYMPQFNKRKVLFFSEPYAKNTSKNDSIFAYNRMLESEVFHVEKKYPNLKLFDCNYFLRRNNYLGFKHELRGYAKYILAKYVLFCIRFGFGYNAVSENHLVEECVENFVTPYDQVSENIPPRELRCHSECVSTPVAPEIVIMNKTEGDTSTSKRSVLNTKTENAKNETRNCSEKPQLCEVSSDKSEDMDDKKVAKKPSKSRRRRNRNRSSNDVRCEESSEQSQESIRDEYHHQFEITDQINCTLT